MFTGEVGEGMAWLLRHVKANGQYSPLISSAHRTMANNMPQRYQTDK